MPRGRPDLPSVVDWLQEAWGLHRDAARTVITDRVVSHLTPTEEILIATRRHTVVALWTMPASLAVLIVVAYLTAKMNAGNPLIDLLWWFWFGTVGYCGWRMLEWNNDIFVVTDRRVILFTGFITRRVNMMPLTKVTDLTYRRTPAGRLLRYGDFIIESAGQDQALNRIRFLPEPHLLYLKMAGTLFGRRDDRVPKRNPDATLESHIESGPGPADMADTGKLPRIED